VPAPYSNDLRLKIVQAYQAKEGSIRGLAARFRVDPSFVRDLLKRHRETGSVSPKLHVHRGPPPRLDATGLEKLRVLTEANDDATLEELKALLLERHGVELSRAGVHRAVTKLELTRKKSRSRPKSETSTG
jgi:transposase